jgi:hypothetical protein
MTRRFIVAGFRPLDSFGVEVNYVDHGSATAPAGIACVQPFQAPCPGTTISGPSRSPSPTRCCEAQNHSVSPSRS